MKNRLEKLRGQNTARLNFDENMVQSSFLNAANFPLKIEAQSSGVNLTSWIKGNVDKFEKDLIKYGGVLFRNFNVTSVEKFQSLMKSFPKELLEYNLRSSPRHALADNVYVSTTYPNDQSINMHSENSYAPNPPERIVFCCIVAAAQQGETPIADNRKVYANLSKALKQKFEDKGVLYRRNLGGPLGMPWHEVFQSSDRKTVERECYKNNIDFHWKNENELILSWTKDAIVKHPISGEKVWFNHAFFFNKYLLNNDVLSSISSDDELPNNTFFGDGTEISKSEIEEIKWAYNEATVEFPWQEGDVLFLDNMLMSHGRNPYTGNRKIIVSIL